MRITIGCDEGACSLRDVVKAHLRLQNHEVSDFAPLNNESVLFSGVEFKVAEAIMAGQFECGILLCSTGISMTISANKVQGGPGGEVPRYLFGRMRPPQQQRTDRRTPGLA